MKSTTAQKSNVTQPSCTEALARQRAELAASELAQIGSIYAILLATDWQVQSIPLTFEHLGHYEEVAARSGCSLVTVRRDDSGGLEHLLFMTRIAGLDDDQYLECLPDLTEPLDYTLPRRNQT